MKHVYPTEDVHASRAHHNGHVYQVVPDRCFGLLKENTICGETFDTG